ncbi:uncharacterized protein LOC128545846 isoform X2 [Mercenaria mercenaria]|uniref:uncharacterized protein LOC128545846 isoform X1 n=1 Tax=Mercenaria mercenaria TaxID=6596 RepID=UPI00234F59B2|nr:uncharacterized protein LOC128545846 isoform X1 [Mercenaria mercenaria]XP_053401729.1 uncharacterized protein LOC128545846 isoform X2 [Mercenaria mercenaria]
MQGSTQQITQHEIARVRKRYMILFVVKCLLGIILLILGGLAVKNTKGQKGTFGPPYFLGAFIVGCAMILASFMDVLMYRSFTSNDSATLQSISQYACFEVLLTGISVIGGFIGIFFVSIFGVPECEPSDFFSHCNYTKNLSTNRSLAIGILISLLVSEIIAIGSIVIHCRSCQGLGPYNMLKPRQRRFAPHHNVYVAGGAGNVVMTTAPEPRPFAGGFGANRNYNSYSADTQIVIDGNVIDKNRGGFSGAIIHPPENTTVIHPPVGYSQYPSMTNQNTQYSHEGQGSTSGASVHQLQEQNRLLREQIALQQQLQLMQQQQQQQESAPSSSLPPMPPSYESCMQDPEQMKFLQEQNEELQNRYLRRQQITKDIPFSSDRNTIPSAPPM